MRRRLLCVLLISSCLVPQAISKSRSHAPSVIDQNYVSALATAHRFLHAWQAHDQETALLLLTDAVKQHISEDQLGDLFEGSAPATYEITRGKKITDGRYAFPVTLFQNSAGRRGPHPRYSQLIVLNTGKDDWAIDKLP